MKDIDKLKAFRFMQTMLNELENNAQNKGSVTEWEGLQEKIFDLEYHKSKLMLAIKEENEEAIQEFIADCANTLLSIGDEYGIYDDDIKHDTITHLTRDTVFRRSTDATNESSIPSEEKNNEEERSSERPIMFAS